MEINWKHLELNPFQFTFGFFVALNDKLKQLTSLFKFEPYKMPILPWHILPTMCITEKLEYVRYMSL